MLLMLAGGAGIITTLATVLLSFSRIEEGDAIGVVVLLVVGLALLWLAARSSIVDRALTRVIDGALRRFTDLDVRDYHQLLRLADDYRVSELQADEQDWLAGSPLRDLRLPDEGVLVLEVTRRGGHWVGAPGPDTALQPGDVVVLYGRQDSIARLDARPAGAVVGDAEAARERQRHHLEEAAEGAAGEAAAPSTDPGGSAGSGSVT